jgi:hypothetical protein
VLFDLTKEEWDTVQRTQAHLLVNSALDYNDGFQRQVVQDNCTAFPWGNPAFGRSVIKCAEVPTYPENGKKYGKALAPSRQLRAVIKSRL